VSIAQKYSNKINIKPGLKMLFKWIMQK